MTLALSVDTLLARLQGARGRPMVADALAFDGDGTLWSGDVAEDVFIFATAHDLLRDEPTVALRDVARSQGLPLDGSASAIAQRLFQAYLEGRFPEREVCEVMAWCFAGYSRSELRELTETVFAETDLEGRLNRTLSPVLDWARRERLRVVLVSASPRPIVEVAAARWGFSAADIAASTPAQNGEQIEAHLAGPIPYGPTKPLHARALLGLPRWLAAFGDSGFDFELLAAAEQPVAVRPKPSLLARLPELGPNAATLE